MSNINPFGTSTDSPTNNLAQIKLFGCTVVDFNVSADWSSQGGSLSCRLIESETDGDGLTLPVLGSPVLFELKTRPNTPTINFPNGSGVFQYIGIVDSFSRSSSNSKTYSVTISSPLKILDSTTVILNGYAGLGGSIEASEELNRLTYQNFGHNNNSIYVDNIPGTGHWWNVSNLINVFGILENDDPLYRVPTNPEAYNNQNTAKAYGDFGFAGSSEDGITLIKLMWALHIGINHLPQLNTTDAAGLLRRQKTHGGNLLFGRHNYNVYDPVQREAIPYYYHFDAIHFYNQVVNKLGPEYRIGGQYKTLTEIISEICNEANLEFFSYIDIYTDPTIGQKTLQEEDLFTGNPAKFNWIAGAGGIMIPEKFPFGGNYGGTIRIQTIDKNSFFNPYRPFSNIAYNLIGLEVPDLRDSFLAHEGIKNPNRNGEGWVTNTKHDIHPGRRPINNTDYGLSPSSSPSYQTYSDPLDSSGIQLWRGSQVSILRPEWGYTKAGTMSVASGGSFPVELTGVGGTLALFDQAKLNFDIYPRVKNSDISIKLNDLTTMKVVTGGYQTRLITTPRKMIRHYWGDITLPNIPNLRGVKDTATDSFGLDETSTRKIPVVTPLLDPKDIDDFILIDMKNDVGLLSISGVFHQGIYAASLLEIRCAMSSIESWKAFVEKYKYEKVRRMTNYLYPDAIDLPAQNGRTKDELEKSTETINKVGGLGYVGASDLLGLGNTFALHRTLNNIVSETHTKSGEPITPTGAGNGLFGLGINFTKAMAESQIKAHVLPLIHEKVKEIGDTHYGKSWYAPVPYAKTIEDLDGDNLVGNFKRAWELADAAYVEPSAYYNRQIPQSNMFISDGKVNPFLNYDHNFLTSNTGAYDTSYVTDITNMFGMNQKICNFSEYNVDQLCITKYSEPTGIDGSGNLLYPSGIGNDILHAAPDNVSNTYSFLPIGYERYYNRAVLPFSDIMSGQKRKYSNDKNASGTMPSSWGQSGTSFNKTLNDIGGLATDLLAAVSTSFKPFVPAGGGAGTSEIPDESGYFNYGTPDIPSLTQPQWLINTVSNLLNLDYSIDNGRYGFPFVKFTSSRVFLPVPLPGRANASGMGDVPLNGMNAFLGTEAKRRNGVTNPSSNISPSGRNRQSLLTEDEIVSVLKPFQACVVPKSFSYAQVSTRYVYGPWITSIPYVPFRGKVEYEQDESLVPENFLIPTNFGPFGQYSLNQISGLKGLDLAAQGRANAIDDFALFAVEEGSITIPHAPGIKRIGDSLYGLQQITDIKINVSNDLIETTYTFKTISPKFGKNNRDLEKKLTKISNTMKKIKLR